MQAQDTDSTGHWYFGVSGGAAFGQCTFRSLTPDDCKPGGTGAIFVGYGLSPVFSLECSAAIGSMKLHSQKCDPFWLSDAHVEYFAPVIDQKGDFYKNITTKTNFSKFALQLNIDLLKIFTDPCSRLSLTISPQISYVNTKSKLSSKILSKKFDGQHHFGYGAQTALGCFVSKKIELQLYAGLTCLSGDRFDNIPERHHTSNFIWDGGIKIAFRPGRICGEKTEPPISDNNPEPVAQPEVDTSANVQIVDVPTVDTTETQPPVVIEDNKQPEPVQEEVQPPAVIPNLPVIYFADNGVTISQKELTKIREIADYLKSNPDTEVCIIGYASKSGTKEYNKYISQRRCEVVKRRIMQLGIAESRFVKLEGKGVDESAADSKSARRVEVIIAN